MKQTFGGIQLKSNQLKKRTIPFGINKIFILSIFLFVTLSFYSSNINAQNSDLEAQFSYKQGEDALAKEDFSTCVKYCEKAATQLGKTNQKILSLQFQAYSGQLKKDCTAPLLSDKTKIDTYLKYYFDNFSTTTDQNKLFEVMKFRDDWNEFKTNGCKEPNYLKSYNIGLSSIEQNDYGLLGDWLYTYIGLVPNNENITNIFQVPDSKYLGKMLAVISYSINGKTTYTDKSVKSYTDLFNNDLKEAQKSGIEKITVTLEVCIIKGLSNKKTGCTTISGSFINPINK